MDNTETSKANRLSLLYILSVTAGVGVAISIAQGIEHLRFPADAAFHRLKEVRRLGGFDALVASLYGVCVTTFIFAWRSGGLWSSPGKILSLLFATMCVLNWTLDLFAAAVMNYRMHLYSQSVALETSIVGGGNSILSALGPSENIFGIWYRNFAPSIGYVAGLPVLAFVIYKTRFQRFYWQAVWIGFFIASLLIAGSINFDLDNFLPGAIGSWYFEIATGIPMILLAIALLVTVARREQLDWWTIVTAPLAIGVWSVLIGLKAMN
jgi:hypothetical protein